MVLNLRKSCDRQYPLGLKSHRISLDAPRIELHIWLAVTGPLGMWATMDHLKG